MLRSISVVLGSYILSFVLVLCTDPLLMKMYPGDFERGHVPSSHPLMWSTGFFIVISIFCAWLCAKMAARNPGKHVLWFFILGETMGVAFTVVNWGNGWPHWYGLSWLLSWPVSCWVGAKLGGSKEPARMAATM